MHDPLDGKRVNRSLPEVSGGSGSRAGGDLGRVKSSTGALLEDAQSVPLMPWSENRSMMKPVENG